MNVFPAIPLKDSSNVLLSVSTRSGIVCKGALGWQFLDRHWEHTFLVSATQEELDQGGGGEYSDSTRSCCTSYQVVEEMVQGVRPECLLLSIS